MKKRLFAFLMAFVMILSVVPLESLAASNKWPTPGGSTATYGTNLGWEYAVIESNGSGFDLKDPKEGNLGSYVTVKINGTSIQEGTAGLQNGVLTEGSKGIVNISCAYGYYIAEIVLACGHTSDDDPFECRTVQTDDAYEYALSNSTPTSVNIELGALWSHANHDSRATNYFLMIELAPIPENVYVGYDSGSVNGVAITARPVAETGTLADGAIEVGSHPTWKYSTTGLASAPVHAALGINPDAEKEANDLGYSFAGWKLEYYTEYEDSDNTFSGFMKVGEAKLSEGTSVTLDLNAKLTAIWQPLTTVSVTKEWDDANDQDGLRPDSVEVYLLKNGSYFHSATLNADNDWTASWTVPKQDENGKDINYTVQESVPANYTVSISGDASSGYTLTNTHIVERTSVQVQKRWNDDTNRDGWRPYGVKVQLYCNGSPVTSYVDAEGNTISGIATLTESTSWTQQWMGLVKNRSDAVGTANEYSVKEIGYVDKDGNAVANPGYSVDYYTDHETGTLVVENTYTPATIDIPVEKVWADEDNQDGIRPDSVTVTLYANGVATGNTLVLNQKNGWKGTFEGVYANDKGNPITYSVVEDAVDGYSASVTHNSDGSLTVTNTHTPQITSVTVNKEWDDNDDQDGKRPKEIKVVLYADNELKETRSLYASDDWEYTFTNLPKYRDGGTLIEYTVAEHSVPDGYTSSITGNASSGYTITNSYTPETANLNVVKSWDDADNNDGKRPYAVVITLYIDGDPSEYSLTLSEENKWSGSWDGMPRYHNGQRISYSAVETGYYSTAEDLAAGKLTEGIPAGYTVTHSYDTTNPNDPVATITNAYTPETTGINIQKVWDDDYDRAGLRPDSVTVTLYQKVGDGEWEATSQTATLSPANEWDADFVNLPRYSGGQLVTYKVVETALDPDLGYEEAEYRYDDAARVITIINTRKVEKVNVSVSKEWNDANNQDGIRPEEITVTLYANGLDTKTTKTLSADDWTATFENLYKHYNGKAIEYTVKEIAVTDYATEYTSTTDADGNVSIVVKNTHTPETVSVPVMKVWSDAEDQDGIRPDSITVTLYADGEAVETIDLTASGNWSGSFTGLPKYREGEVRKEIVYTVAEHAVPDGYTASVTGNASSGYTITNTHEPAKTSVKVTKVWDDEENQDGVRPDSITLHLRANGAPAGEPVTLSETTGWSYEWSGLDKYEEGKEINYTVYESVVGNGYAPSYDRDDEGNVIITNTRNTEKTSYTVQKVWSDRNNQDNIRPYGVVVQLYATSETNDTVATGDPVTLTADNHWRYSWSGLDVHAEGGEGDDITYSVEELYYVDASGTQIELDALEYMRGTPVVDADTGVVTITNTHEVEKTSVSVTKNWDDSENRDGIRPAEITVELYRNGSATGSIATLDDDNNWSYTWTGLDVHHGIGIDNVYTVVETDVPTGYTSVTTGSAESGYVITNTHKLETIDVPVMKVWSDAEDQDGKRPDSITVTLYADGEAVKTIDLTASGNWSGSFTGLPKYREGEVRKEIVYTVAEYAVPDGYTESVTGYTITNSHTPETAKLNVVKSWDDADNNDGKRPYAVVITLYINGDPSEYSLTLSEENKWSGSWDDMPRYHNGQRISYSVVETGYYSTAEDLAAGKLTEGVPDGYTVTHSYDTTNPNDPVATITNSYTPETTGINIQKVWADADDQDGIRPDTITVTLYRKIGENGSWTMVTDDSGNPVTDTLSEDNEWDADFVGLPKWHDGELVYYKVVEDAVEGYTTEYSMNQAIGVVTIINTHTTERTEVAVNKHWDDDNDRDNIRPAYVTVELYANGVATGNTLVLNQKNGWKGTFTDLAKNHHGEEILYTVKEARVPTGYTASVTGNASTGYTISNYHDPETIQIPVVKNWDDGGDQDGIRPDTITVTLYANDTAVQTITLSAADNWQGTFGNLPVYENGKRITYRLEESALIGYNTTYTSDDTTEGVLNLGIVNTHKPEQTTLTVIKSWNDNEDQDGKRPDSITVHLLADGVDTGKTVVLTEDMGWTYTWTELAKYNSGHEIRYVVYEEPVYLNTAVTENTARAVDTYTASYVRNPDDPTEITITNTYATETVTISAMKVWKDDSDRDGLRLDSITAVLYADGVATGDTLTLSDENNWAGSWTHLPKYRDHGVEIEYSVAEAETITGYDVVITEDEHIPGLFIMTNTHTPATTGVNVNKVWNDESDNDGKRPDGIIVQLYANGSAVEGASVVLCEENRWSNTWVQLDGKPLYVYEGGEEISYYVDEIGYVVDGVEYEGLPEGYVKETSTKSYEVVITNTREVEKTSVTAAKVWNDAENQDGIRPAAVSLTLYCNGEAVSSAQLDETNSWSYTWSDLYKYVAGEEAVYTVEETAVSGYEVTYAESTDSNGGIRWTVTNTHEVETKEITVSKVWVDNNDAEGLRPDSVSVQLYKNGKAYGSVMILSETNNWKYTVEIPVYENGVKVTWTIAETVIPRYYTATYNQSTLTVTNTLQSKDVPKTGDSNDLLFWTGMMMTCIAGAVAVIFYDRRKKRA